MGVNELLAIMKEASNPSEDEQVSVRHAAGMLAIACARKMASV